MDDLLDSNLIIYDNDTMQIYEYIDVIQVQNGYRMHNVCSGVILQIDKFTALVTSILKKQLTFKELMNELATRLTDTKIDTKIVKYIIEYLLDIGFLNLTRQRYSTKILLINPCYQYSNNAYKKISIVPPLGILYIATELFNAGYNVFIIDMLLNNIRPDELGTYIAKYQPDIVGISMNFTSTADICYEIAENIHSLGVQHIFVGGNHATFTYKEILSKEYIQYVVQYQGEKTVLDLVEIIRKQDWKSLDFCKGIVFKKEKKIVINESREFVDINNRGVPAWHLLDIYLYEENNRWSLNTSLGCPCSCVFCSTSSFNKKMCFMNIENIVRLLKKILRINGGKTINISFSDDAFTCSKQRVYDLCEWIINNNFPIIWACSTRVDLVDEQLLNYMFKAGCRAVLFGIESCSNETLKKIGKKIDIETAKQAIKIAKNAGMKVKEMFILGLPYESKESIKLIENFVKETNPDEVRFGMLAMYPGTPIWYNSAKYGINLLTKKWGDFDLLRPTTNNTLMKEQEIYNYYINLTEMYEQIS